MKLTKMTKIDNKKKKFCQKTKKIKE